MRNRIARGQAITETAIFMPITLLVLWGIIWTAQYGVLSERVQSAIRYSGLISNQINPFTQYSMYVLYNSLAAPSTSPLPTQTCNAPSTDALSNSGTYPGPTSGPFWTATSAPATLSCAGGSNSQTAVYSGLNQTAIAISNHPRAQVQVNVPNYLQTFFGNAASLPATGSTNFIRPADMSTMLNCHSGMQAVLLPSLQPTPAAQPATDALPSPTAIPEPMPSPAAISVSC